MTTASRFFAWPPPDGEDAVGTAASLRSAGFVMFCVFFPIGLIGLIGLIIPIGLIAPGFLRENLMRRLASLGGIRSRR